MTRRWLTESAEAFVAARDFCLWHRTDYETAQREFTWPRLEHFNWAVDYFDAMAAGNDAPALHIVNEDGSEQICSFSSMSIRSSQVANFLRARGIRIAIDDFGTGYSSLAYLRRFPVDGLKIARELIGVPVDPTGSTSDDPDDQETWAFARAIVAMGRSLGLPVVAEGIETPSQLEALRALQCELGQGYLLGKPSGPGVVIAELLARTPRRLSA